MKRILAISIATLISGQALAEGPVGGKVYGKLNVAVIESGDGTTATNELVSNSSRLGFKGESELEGGVTAFYKMEFQVNPDSGNSSVTSSSNDTLVGDVGNTVTGTTVTDTDTDTTIFKQRDIFVGLKGSWGSVKAGMYNTPLKSAQKKVDLFNDLAGGDIKNLFNGEERVSDAVQYCTPKVAGLKLAVMRQFHDEATAGKVGVSTALTYENGGFYAAVANDQNVDDKQSNKDVNRVVVQYNMDAMQLGLLYSSSKKSETTDEAKSGFLGSFSYKTGDLVWKAQYGSSDEKSLGNTQTAFGVDYKLAKSTKTFFYYSAFENDAAVKANTTGIGMEHKF